MASTSAGDLGRHLGRLFGAGSAAGLTDGELLERFAQRRDEVASAAFETILARHAAMVLTVCRQVLGDAHAAEDAFQATFLVLVQRRFAASPRAWLARSVVARGRVPHRVEGPTGRRPAPGARASGRDFGGRNALRRARASRAPGSAP